MKMVEVKTAELIGPALDWAVAKALGYYDGEDAYHNPAWMHGGRYIASKHMFCPSADWSEGGPLIDNLMRSKRWEMVQWGDDVAFQSDFGGCISGRTPLIAACRTIVADRLGDAVRVPAALVGGGA